MPRFEDIRVLTLPMAGVITPTIIREITAAFSSLGAETLLLQDFTTFGGILDGIAKYKPDFVFTIDYIISRNNPGFFSELNVPLATWFVDLPVGLGLSTANKADIFFASDETWLAYIRRVGGKHTYFLPLCTNPQVFCPEQDESKIAPFRTDTSFLGSAMYDNEIDKLMAAPNVSFAMKQAFNAIMERRVEHPGEEFDKIVAASAPEFSALFSTPTSEPLKFLLLQHAAHLVRLKYISALGAGVHVYGDEKWSGLASSGINVHPGLDPTTEAPLLYQASRVNLNFSAGQLDTALNQRIFDINACGGFVLTDFRSDLKRLFNFGTEVASFSSLPDMKDKIAFYLKNEDARRAITEKANKRVLAEHTYENRAEKILETFISIYRK